MWKELQKSADFVTEIACTQNLEGKVSGDACAVFVNMAKRLLSNQNIHFIVTDFLSINYLSLFNQGLGSYS